MTRPRTDQTEPRFDQAPEFLPTKRAQPRRLGGRILWTLALIPFALLGVLVLAALGVALWVAFQLWI